MVLPSLRKLYDSPFKVTQNSSQKGERDIREEELCVDLSRVYRSCEKTLIMLEEGVAGQKTFERDEVLEGSEEDLLEFGQNIKQDKNLVCRGYKLKDQRISLPLKDENQTELDHQGNNGRVFHVHDGGQQMIVKYVLLEKWRYAELAVPLMYHLWLKQHQSQAAGLVKILAVYVDELFVVTLQEDAGKNFQETFFGSPVDVPTLKSIMKQGLYTLHQLSQMNICLGDIKPENMAVKDGLVRFIDYGSASIAVDKNFGSGLSLAYRAPEYLREVYPNLNLSPSGDVFLFGVTVLSLATGRHAWVTFSERWEEEQTEKLVAQIKDRPETVLELLPKSWGPKLHHLLQKMLTVHPGSRITAEMALEDEYFKEDEAQNVFDPTDMIVSSTPEEDIAPTELGQGDATVLREAEELVLEKMQEGKLSEPHTASHVTSRGVNRQKHRIDQEETEVTGAALVPTTLAEVEFSSRDIESQQQDPVQVPRDLATFWFEVPDDITGKVFIIPSKSPLHFSVKWAEGCHISGEFTIPKKSQVIYRKKFRNGESYVTAFTLKGDTRTEAWFEDRQMTEVPRVLQLVPPDTSRLACKLYLHQSITTQVIRQPSRKPCVVQFNSPISGHFDICVKKT